MSRFLDELLAARSSGPHGPGELDRSVIEQGGELVRLRAVMGVVCNVLVERNVISRGELMELLRDALHEIDPLMLPSLRRPSTATGPVLPPGANPYRDAAVGIPEADERVVCIRCSRVVARMSTNLTAQGPICDTCWEPSI